MQIQESGTILIPVDFTDQSLLAVKQSYNLAKYTKSKIIFLYAYEKQANERDADLRQLVSDTVLHSGIPSEYEVVKGNIYKETNRIAAEKKATLIMLGLESRMSLKNVVGHSASKMVREAPCAVISIRGKEHRDGCENILLPLDLSPESREKAVIAVQFAHYFGAAIRILSVFSNSDAEYENQLLAYAYQVKQYIKGKGVSCTNKSIGSDNIAETVVEYANKIEADLIMIMNKQELNIKEFFSGTEAQKIVDISNIPVMTVNPMKRESLGFGVH